MNSNSLLTIKLYHVSACDSVSATYVVVFSGALGTRFSLTDKPWERPGPGVLFSAVNDTSERKNQNC